MVNSVQGFLVCLAGIQGGGWVNSADIHTHTDRCTHRHTDTYRYIHRYTHIDTDTHTQAL